MKKKKGLKICPYYHFNNKTKFHYCSLVRGECNSYKGKTCWIMYSFTDRLRELAKNRRIEAERRNAK